MATPRKKTPAVDEKELMGTKWFEYRVLTPDTATLCFIGEWAKAYTTYNENMGRSKHFQFLKNIARFEIDYLKGSKKNLWNAMEALRQWADQKALPYNLFWTWAFDAHTKLGFRKTFVTAFKNKRLLAAVLDRANEYREFKIIRSRSAMFRASAYRGYPVQREYYEYLTGEVMRRYPSAFEEILREMVKDGELADTFLDWALSHRLLNENNERRVA